MPANRPAAATDASPRLCADTSAAEGEPHLHRLDPRRPPASIRRYPLRLRSWCMRCATPCDGQLLLDVALTGFRSWRRGTRLLQAIAAIILAAACVWLKFDPALIYADDRDLVTFEGGPLRPMVEPVRIGYTREWQGPLPPGLSAPPAPEAPAAPDVPPRPQGPGTIITRSGYFL